MIGISNFTFYECEELKNVVLPSGLRKIGSFAFAHCKSLRTINFPDSLVQVDTFAFSICVNLGKVRGKTERVPLRFTENIKLEDYAFSSCLLGEGDYNITENIKDRQKLVFGDWSD